MIALRNTPLNLDGEIMSNRHNVFISYHHKNDELYKLEFERLFSGVYDILETKAINDGDINPFIKTETIRQKIRDEFICTASVTVVLIGSETWKRKHVDWEISSSIRDTKLNSRTGLIQQFPLVNEQRETFVDDIS